jgi:hypothetical protein
VRVTDAIFVVRQKTDCPRIRSWHHPNPAPRSLRHGQLEGGAEDGCLFDRQGNRIRTPVPTLEAYFYSPGTSKDRATRPGGYYPGPATHRTAVAGCNMRVSDITELIPQARSDDGLGEPKLGAVGQAIYEAINLCSDLEQLDGMGRLLWKGNSEGSIVDGEATYLSSCIERRRPLGRRTAPGHTMPLGKLAGRLYSRFTPRQRQRSPDRKASRDRRRMLGGSSALPDSHRHHYTEGQRAFLCIVAGEVKRHGICDFPIDKIAALAGVCRTTAQTTMHEARRLGHLKITERPQRGRKSLTNVMEIISPEWRAWMRRAPSAAHLIGSNLVKMVSPTKNTDLRKKAATEEKEGGKLINRQIVRQDARQRASPEASCMSIVAHVAGGSHFSSRRWAEEALICRGHCNVTAWKAG